MHQRQRSFTKARNRIVSLLWHCVCSAQASARAGRSRIEKISPGRSDKGLVNHPTSVHPSSTFNIIIISSFNFEAKEVYVAAGYSLRDWKALLPKKRVAQIEKKPLKLPNAHGLCRVSRIMDRISLSDRQESTMPVNTVRLHPLLSKHTDFSHHQS